MPATTHPWKDRPSARRIVAFFVALICIAAQVSLLYTLREPIRKGSEDFIDFYAGGRIVATGNASRLYDLAFQAQVEGIATGQPNSSKILPFVHPPYFAVWLAILGVFPYPAAYYIWWGCNLCFFWLALFLIDRALGGSTLRPERIACAGLFFLPVAIAFWQGQDSLLVLFLFSVAYLFLSRGRAGLAGVALGLAAFKPQLALLMLVVLMFTWRDKRRLMAGFVLTCLAQLGIAAAVLGWRVLAGYPKALASITAAFDESRYDFNSMPNLWGLLHFLLAGRLPHSTLMGILIVLSVALLASTILVLRSLNAQMQSEQLRYAFATVCVVLTAYHGHFHDMSLLLLPLLLTWGWLDGTTVRGLRRRLLVYGVGLAFLGGILVLPLPRLLAPVFACAAIIFWGLLLWNLVAPEQATADIPAQTNDSASNRALQFGAIEGINAQVKTALPLQRE